MLSLQTQLGPSGSSLEPQNYIENVYRQWSAPHMYLLREWRNGSCRRWHQLQHEGNEIDARTPAQFSALPPWTLSTGFRNKEVMLDKGSKTQAATPHFKAGILASCMPSLVGRKIVQLGGRYVGTRLVSAWHRRKMVWQHLWLGVRLLPSVTSRKCTPLKGNRKREQKSSNRTKLTKLAQQKERLFDPKPLEFQIHLWQLQLRTYEPLPAPQFYPVPSNPSTFVEISLPCFISAQGSTWGLKQWSDAALIW